jgi:hypothetical protein
MELVRNKNRRQPRKEWPSAANTSEGLTLPAAAILWICIDYFTPLHLAMGYAL